VQPLRFRIRILRLRQIGLNRQNNPALGFNSFDLFGDLFRYPNRDWHSIRFDSIESDLLELKATLITRRIFQERIIFEEDHRFNGILAFLTRDCDGKASNRGIVEIRSSSFFHETHLPKNAAHFTWTSLPFESKSAVNQWIEWDSKHLKLSQLIIPSVLMLAKQTVLICDIG
jgi:hypothetical protein